MCACSCAYVGCHTMTSPLNKVDNSCATLSIYRKSRQQPTSFLRIIYVILRISIGLSSSFRKLLCSEHQRNIFLLITYRRKAACNKYRCKRTIFHNKCELLKCCGYRKHFVQIHHIISCNVFGQSVCRIKKKIGSWFYFSVAYRSGAPTSIWRF